MLHVEVLRPVGAHDKARDDPSRERTLLDVHQAEAQGRLARTTLAVARHLAHVDDLDHVRPRSRVVHHHIDGAKVVDVDCNREISSL